MKNSDLYKKFFFGSSGSGLRKISTRISFWSVFIGSFALIISLSVLEGFDQELHNSAYKIDSHLKITTFDRQDIPNYLDIIEKIDSKVENSSSYPVIEKYALVQINDKTDGFLIKGVDAEYFKKRIINIDIDNHQGLIISKSISAKYNAKIGDDLVVFTLNQNNQSRIKKIKVTGIYQTGFGKVDENLIFYDFESTKELFAIENSSCSKIEVDLNDPERSRKLGQYLDEELGWPFYAESVYDIHAGMFNWIGIQKKPIPIILGIISLVAVFNIITSLLITIVEKYKEIGILRCLGMTKSKITKMIISGGLTTGLKGVIFGLGAGSIILMFQDQFKIISLPPDIYFIDSVPVKFLALHYLIIFFSINILTFLAALIPSFLAMRFSPIKTIRSY